MAFQLCRCYHLEFHVVGPFPNWKEVDFLSSSSQNQFKLGKLTSIISQMTFKKLQNATYEHNYILYFTYMKLSI